MLSFDIEEIRSRIVLPSGEATEKVIEVRTHPITGRTCRITLSRADEREPGAESLPDPPPFASDRSRCPFCSERVNVATPQLVPELAPEGRIKRGASILIPNLFPYGSYSAVSLFDDNHFVEIGTASLESYTDCFLNCLDYLGRIRSRDPEARYMAVTQNHLPSAGGSLLHPHLQIQADRVASNHHRFLGARVAEYHRQTGNLIFSDYLDHELEAGDRYIGRTGSWEWTAAFAPEGFFELWAILPGITSIDQASDGDWAELARGVLNAQRFYRGLCRNGYNFGILFIEDGSAVMELRAVMMVRSNYAPWVRSDFTGFEVMLGDMATFTRPEQTAEQARPFWTDG